MMLKMKKKVFMNIMRYYDEYDLTWCEYGEEYRLHRDVIHLGDEFDNRDATEQYVEDYLYFSEYYDRYIEQKSSTWNDYHNSYIYDGDIIDVYINVDYDSVEELDEYIDTEDRVLDDDSYMVYQNNKSFYNIDKKL